MQAVTELVEQGAGVVEAEQRRLAGRALGEVVVVDDDRPHRGVAAAAAVLRLHPVRAHPGAAALGRPGEVVVQEQADRLAISAAHLVDLDVRVVDHDLRAGDEAQAEQAPGAVECRLGDALQREVGLDLGLVECIADLAHLLGVEAPVPGLDRRRLAAREGERLERRALGRGPGGGRSPHLHQQRGHGLLRAGHGVGERVVGIRRVAVQPGLLEAQGQDLGGDAAVVARPRMLAARRPGAPRLLAQVAPLGEGEKGDDVRARKRDHPGVGDAAFARGLPCRGADEVRQAGEVRLAAQHQVKAGFVGEHVLAEAGGQVGQPLHHLGITLLRRAVQARAGAHEVGVIALEHAQLLVAEAELVAPAVKRVDPREQGVVHVDAAVVRRQQRRHVALDRLQRRRGFARGEVVEQPGDPVEQAAGAIERGHGVVEGRRLARIADGADFREMVSHRELERRGEVLGPGLGERRQAVLAGPGLQQGVVALGLGRHFLRLMSFRSRSS